MVEILTESKRNPYKFKSANGDYSGGGITIFYGELADGTYFYADDANYDVTIVDLDPSVEHDGTEYDGVMLGDDWGWIEDHAVKFLDTEKEGPDFWLSLYDYCKKSNSDVSKWYDFENHIAEINELKTKEHWR